MANHNDIEKLFEGLGLDKNRLTEEQKKRMEELESAEIKITKTPTAIKVEGKASSVNLVAMLQAFEDVVKQITGFGVIEILAMKDIVKPLVEMTGLSVQSSMVCDMILHALKEASSKGDKK